MDGITAYKGMQGVDQNLLDPELLMGLVNGEAPADGPADVRKAEAILANGTKVMVTATGIDDGVDGNETFAVEIDAPDFDLVIEANLESVVAKLQLKNMETQDEQGVLLIEIDKGKLKATQQERREATEKMMAKLDKALATQKAMKAVSWLLVGLSVLGAILSGGALSAVIGAVIAVGMAVLNETGVIEKAQKALCSALKDSGLSKGVAEGLSAGIICLGEILLSVGGMCSGAIIGKIAAKAGQKAATTAAKTIAKQVVKQATDEATKAVIKNVGEKAIKQATEAGIKEAVEQVAKEAVDEAVQAAVKEAVQDAVNTTVEKSVEQAIEKSGEKSVESAVGEAVKKGLTEQVTNQATQAALEAVKKLGADASKEAVQAAIKEAVKNTVSEALKDSVQTAVKDSVKEAVTKTIEESAKAAGNSAVKLTAENAAQAAKSGATNGISSTMTKFDPKLFAKLAKVVQSSDKLRNFLFGVTMSQRVLQIGALGGTGYNAYVQWDSQMQGVDTDSLEMIQKHLQELLEQDQENLEKIVQLMEEAMEDICSLLVSVTDNTNENIQQWNEGTTV